MTKARYFKLIVILGLLTALGPFLLICICLALQVKDLNTTVANVAMTLSSYFIEDFCRTVVIRSFIRSLWKKPLFIGLLVYILASLGCVL
jgi:DHA1 family bicyclomycin/chloramphenicol resistance-like MFS transporter